MRIAILEDNPGMRRMLQTYLKEAGYENVYAFQEVKAFLNFFTTSDIDILITDYRLMTEQGKSNLSGADVIRRVRKDRHELPVILISAATMFELQDDCRDIADVHIMQKPFPVKQLLGTIEALNK